MSKIKKNTSGSAKPYVVGLVLSILLTVTAYLSVVHKLFTGWTLIYVILALAITQAIVQLVFFLHLSEEKKPRYNLSSLLYTILVIFIVVVGSVWIMHNLDYNMMPQHLDEYMIKESGF